MFVAFGFVGEVAAQIGSNAALSVGHDVVANVCTLRILKLAVPRLPPLSIHSCRSGAAVSRSATAVKRSPGL